jgi:DNA repair photolyase
MKHYGSPRWSFEITDCSLPMTFDPYSKCSYKCQYCFSENQKAIGNSKEFHLHGDVTYVNVEKVKELFLGKKPQSQFWPFIRDRKVLQVGGLADQFDEYERKHGVTLELLKFWREIEYPVTFSTKATWWVYDDRYREVFDGYPWFNVKFSIISMEEDKVKIVEKGVPSTEERLKAMKEASQFVGGGVYLRFRPFIIGMSDPRHVELIDRAAEAGAEAMSTEFFCLERRSPDGRERRYPEISRAIGFDVEEFYAKHSKSTYARLNRKLKAPYIMEMREAARRNGMRFYVSDFDWKELSDNGCCCGLPPEWNYFRGQDTEALMIAKEKGEVKWSDIAPENEKYLDGFLFRKAQGYNTGGAENRAKFHYHTMSGFLHYLWNRIDNVHSPYKMFDGVLLPDRRDENGDIVYKWNGSDE